MRKIKTDKFLENHSIQPNPDHLQALFRQLDNIFLETEYNGVYGIVNAQEILHTGKMGFSDLEKKLLFDRRTKTCIGSVTKQFVATALLMLQEEKKVNLDSPLDLYFPDYPFSKEITLQQMIQMASGIPDYTMISYEQHFKRAEFHGYSEEERAFLAEMKLGNTFSLTEVLSEISLRPLDFEAGSKFSYSNTNYYLLGEIITKITGDSYGNYLKRKIFNPLHMLGTSTTTDDTEATSYRKINGSLRRFTEGILTSADGSIVSTLDDMIKWLQGILRGELLSASDWNKIFNLFNNQYGFGWMPLDDWYYHGGQYLGFYAEIFLHREAKIGKIMLYNLEPAKELDQKSMDERSLWRRELVRLFRS